MLNGQVNRAPITPRTTAVVVATLLAITIPIAGFSAFAQTRFATVAGTVTDPSGGVLVDATLVLSNPLTKARHEVRTDPSGFYEFVGLPAGTYRFEARTPGFEISTAELRLGVGERMQRNLMLNVGSVEEVISVVGGPVERAAATSRVTTAPPPRRRPCPNPAVGGCIGPPVKVKDVRPVYPPELRGSAIQGTVMIEGFIDTEGRMKDMRVVSSPHAGFEQSALHAVGQWEFTPTTLNDREIDTRITVRVTFRPE